MLFSMEGINPGGDRVVKVEALFTTPGRGWRASLTTAPERAQPDTGTLLWMLGQFQLR